MPVLSRLRKGQSIHERQLDPDVDVKIIGRNPPEMIGSSTDAASWSPWYSGFDAKAGRIRRSGGQSAWTKLGSSSTPGGDNVATDKARIKALETGMASLLESQQALLALARGQSADAVAAKAIEPAAAAVEKRAIPHTPELGTLKGLCSPSAQATVERQFAKGAGEFTEYMAHLREASPAFGKTPRTAYASALEAHNGETATARKRGRPRKS